MDNFRSFTEAVKYANSYSESHKNEIQNWATRMYLELYNTSTVCSLNLLNRDCCKQKLKGFWIQERNIKGWWPTVCFFLRGVWTTCYPYAESQNSRIVPLAFCNKKAILAEQILDILLLSNNDNNCLFQRCPIPFLLLNQKKY